MESVRWLSVLPRVVRRYRRCGVPSSGSSRGAAVCWFCPRWVHGVRLPDWSYFQMHRGSETVTSGLMSVKRSHVEGDD